MAKFIFKYIKPSFCLFLSIVFFYSNVIAINLAEASLWEERKRAAQKLNKEDTLDEPQIPDQLPSKLTQEDYQLLAQVPQAAHLGFAVPDKITIAPNSIHSSTNFKQSTPKDVETWLSTLVLPFGSIRDIYLSKKEDAPMIIHIQDAHEIIEAQKNMASMIQGLVEERGINLVGLEGAEGAFALDPYRAYPNPKITKGIADYFMKEGYIGGPEFFGITATKAPVLWGVEDINLYQGNIKAYQETIKYKPGIQTFLAELKKGAFQLKEKIYTDELKSFDQHFNAYKNWQEGLGIYVEYLTSVYPKNKERYLNLYLLLEALNWEKKLDFKQVEQERLKLVEVFAKELSEEQLSNLVQQSMLYRLGRMTYAVYYQYLKKVSEQNRISLENFKQLKTYINYVYLADKIDRNQLSVELSNLEETAQSSLATNPEQKRLIALNSNLLLLEKLTSQTMTPEDWLYYKVKDKEILNIAEETKALASSIGENLNLNVPENFKEAIQPSKQFCEYAVKRNEAIVENLLKKIKAEKTSKAILIAGGFHSEGLMQIWRQKEISYVVVAPKITEVPKESHYLDVFARDPIPLEKLFAGEIIYLVSWRLTASGANQIAGAAPKIQAFEGILASLQSLMTKAESSPEEWEKKSSQYEKFAEDLKSIDEFEISKEAVSMRDSLYQSLLFRKDGKSEYVVVAAKKENFEMAERENYFGKDGLDKEDMILEKGEITIEGKLYVIRIYAHSNFVGKAGKFTRVSSKRVGASFNKLFQAVDQSIEKVVEISSRFFILFARETKAKSWDEIMDQSPMLTARWLYRAVNVVRKFFNKEAKDIDMDEYSQLHAPYLESGLFGIVYFFLITAVPVILYSLGVDSSMVQIYQTIFSSFNVYIFLSVFAGFSHTEFYNYKTKEWENASLLKKVELTIRWMVVHGGLLYIGVYAPGYLGGLEAVFGQFGTLDIARQVFQGMMIAVGIMSGILLHMLHNEKAKIYGWSPLTIQGPKDNWDLMREANNLLAAMMEYIREDSRYPGSSQDAIKDLIERDDSYNKLETVYFERYGKILPKGTEELFRRLIANPRFEEIFKGVVELEASFSILPEPGRQILSQDEPKYKMWNLLDLTMQELAKMLGETPESQQMLTYFYSLQTAAVSRAPPLTIWWLFGGARDMNEVITKKAPTIESYGFAAFYLSFTVGFGALFTALGVDPSLSDFIFNSILSAVALYPIFNLIFGFLHGEIEGFDWKKPSTWNLTKYQAKVYQFNKETGNWELQPVGLDMPFRIALAGMVIHLPILLASLLYLGFAALLAPMITAPVLGVSVEALRIPLTAVVGMLGLTSLFIGIELAVKNHAMANWVSMVTNEFSPEVIQNQFEEVVRYSGLAETKSLLVNVGKGQAPEYVFYRSRDRKLVTQLVDYARDMAISITPFKVSYSRKSKDMSWFESLIFKIVQSLKLPPLTMSIYKIVPSNLSLVHESAVEVPIPPAILNKFIRDYKSSGFAYETAEVLRKVRYPISNHSPEDVNEFFSNSAKSIPIKIKVVEDFSGNRYTILYRTYPGRSGDTYLIALPGLVDVNNISVADGSAGEPGRYNYNVYLHTDAGFRAELLFDSGGNLVWGHEKVFQSNQEVSTDRLPSSLAFLNILPNARAKPSTPQSARMEPANRYGAPINPQEIIPNLLRSRNITDGMTMVYGDISGLVDNAMGIARSIGLSIGRGQMAELIRNSLGIKWDHGKRPDDTFKVNLQLSNLQPQFPTGRMSLPETRSDKILITGKNKIRGLFKNGHVTQGMELLITDNMGKKISIKFNFVDNILTPRNVYGMETGQKVEIENIVSIKAPSSVFAPQSILLKNPSGEVYGRLVTGAENIGDLFRDRQLKKGTQLVIEDITGEERTITFNFLDNIMTPRIVYGMERGQSLQIDRITSVMILSTLGQGITKRQSSRTPPLAMKWLYPFANWFAKVFLGYTRDLEMEEYSQEHAPFWESLTFSVIYLSLTQILQASGIDPAILNLILLIGLSFVAGFMHTEIYNFKSGEWEKATFKDKALISAKWAVIHGLLLTTGMASGLESMMALNILGIGTSIILHRWHNIKAAELGWAPLTIDFAPKVQKILAIPMKSDEDYISANVRAKIDLYERILNRNIGYIPTQFSNQIKRLKELSTFEFKLRYYMEGNRLKSQIDAIVGEDAPIWVRDFVLAKALGQIKEEIETAVNQIKNDVDTIEEKFNFRSLFYSIAQMRRLRDDVPFLDKEYVTLEVITDRDPHFLRMQNGNSSIPYFFKNSVHSTVFQYLISFLDGSKQNENKIKNNLIELGLTGVVDILLTQVYDKVLSDKDRNKRKDPLRYFSIPDLINDFINEILALDQKSRKQLIKTHSIYAVILNDEFLKALREDRDIYVEAIHRFLNDKGNTILNSEFELGMSAEVARKNRTIYPEFYLEAGKWINQARTKFGKEISKSQAPRASPLTLPETRRDAIEFLNNAARFLNNYLNRLGLKVEVQKGKLSTEILIGIYAGVTELFQTFNPFFLANHKNKTWKDWVARGIGIVLIYASMIYAPSFVFEILNQYGSLTSNQIDILALLSIPVANIVTHVVFNIGAAIFGWAPLTLPLLERVKFARVTGKDSIGKEIQLIQQGANLVVTLNNGTKIKLSFGYIDYSGGSGATIIGENGDRIKVDKISEMMVERKGRMLNKAQTVIARESQIAFWNLYPKMQSFGFNWIGSHWKGLMALGNMAERSESFDGYHSRNRVFDEVLPYLLERKEMKWFDQYWDDFVDAGELLSPRFGGNEIVFLAQFLLENEGYEDTIFYIIKNFLNESGVGYYIQTGKNITRYLRRYSAYITAHKSAKYRGRQYSEDKALSLEEFISRSHFEQWSDAVILQTLSHSFFLRYNQLLGTILRLKSKIEEDRGEEFAERWMKENWDSIFTFYLKNLNNIGWIESYLSRGRVEDVVFLSKLFDRNPSLGIEYIRRTLSLGWDYDQLFHIYANKHLRDGDINGAAEFFEKFGFYDPFLHHLQKMGFLTNEAEQAILKIMLEIKNDLDSAASTERLVELINKTVEQNAVEVVAKIDIRKYIINIFRPDLIKAKSPETESLSVKEAQEKINAVVDLLGEESVEWLQLEKYRGNGLLISEDQIHDYFSQLIVKTVELFPDLEAPEIAEIIRGLIEPEIGKMIPLARFLPLLNKAPGKTSFENKQAEYLEKPFRGKPSAPRAPPLTIGWLFSGARDMNEVITKKAPTIESYGFAAFYLSFTVGFGALFTALGIDPSLSDFIFNSILSAVALYPIFNLIFGFLHGEIEGFDWKKPSTWNLSKYQAKVYQFNKETGNWELQPVGLDMPFRIALAGMVIHLPILLASVLYLGFVALLAPMITAPVLGVSVEALRIPLTAIVGMLGLTSLFVGIEKSVKNHETANWASMVTNEFSPEVIENQFEEVVRHSGLAGNKSLVVNVGKGQEPEYVFYRSRAGNVATQLVDYARDMAISITPFKVSYSRNSKDMSWFESLIFKIVQSLKLPPLTIHHKKARSEKPEDYPDRFFVPDDKVRWIDDYPNYAPRPYTALKVKAKPVPVWADPSDINKVTRKIESYEGDLEYDVRDGRRYPLNPRGRTGIQERGELGKWGPNFAADPIVTRQHPLTGQLQMLAIKRDNGEWAIPGGMVDKGELITETLSRELDEETGVKVDMSKGEEIYKGYVDDPRNTDNAWMETTATHLHLTGKDAARLKRPKAGSDAKKAKWMALTDKNISKLYASHGDFVLTVKEKLREQGIIGQAPAALESGRFGIIYFSIIALIPAILFSLGFDSSIISVYQSLFSPMNVYLILSVIAGFSHTEFYNFKTKEWEVASFLKKVEITARWIAVHAGLLYIGIYSPGYLEDLGLAFGPFGTLDIVKLVFQIMMITVGIMSGILLHMLHNEKAKIYGWSPLTIKIIPSTPAQMKKDDLFRIAEEKLQGLRNRGEKDERVEQAILEILDLYLADPVAITKSFEILSTAYYESDRSDVRSMIESFPYLGQLGQLLLILDRVVPRGSKERYKAKEINIIVNTLHGIFYAFDRRKEKPKPKVEKTIQDIESEFISLVAKWRTSSSSAFDSSYSKWMKWLDSPGDIVELTRNNIPEIRRLLLELKSSKDAFIGALNSSKTPQEIFMAWDKFRGEAAKVHKLFTADSRINGLIANRDVNTGKVPNIHYLITILGTWDSDIALSLNEHYFKMAAATLPTQAVPVSPNDLTQQQKQKLANDFQTILKGELKALYEKIGNKILDLNSGIEQLLKSEEGSFVRIKLDPNKDLKRIAEMNLPVEIAFVRIRGTDHWVAIKGDEQSNDPRKAGSMYLFDIFIHNHPQEIEAIPSFTDLFFNYGQGHLTRNFILARDGLTEFDGVHIRNPIHPESDEISYWIFEDEISRIIEELRKEGIIIEGSLKPTDLRVRPHFLESLNRVGAVHKFNKWENLNPTFWVSDYSLAGQLKSHDPRVRIRAMQLLDKLYSNFPSDPGLRIRAKQLLGEPYSNPDEDVYHAILGTYANDPDHRVQYLALYSFLHYSQGKSRDAAVALFLESQFEDIRQMAREYLPKDWIEEEYLKAEEGLIGKPQAPPTLIKKETRKAAIEFLNNAAKFLNNYLNRLGLKVEVREGKLGTELAIGVLAGVIEVLDFFDPRFLWQHENKTWVDWAVRGLGMIAIYAVMWHAPSFAVDLFSQWGSLSVESVGFISVLSVPIANIFAHGLVFNPLMVILGLPTLTKGEVSEEGLEGYGWQVAVLEKLGYRLPIVVRDGENVEVLLAKKSTSKDENKFLVHAVIPKSEYDKFIAELKGAMNNFVWKPIGKGEEVMAALYEGLAAMRIKDFAQKLREESEKRSELGVFNSNEKKLIYVIVKMKDEDDFRGYNLGTAFQAAKRIWLSKVDDDYFYSGSDVTPEIIKEYKNLSQGQIEKMLETFIKSFLHSISDKVWVGDKKFNRIQAELMDGRDRLLLKLMNEEELAADIPALPQKSSEDILQEFVEGPSAHVPPAQVLESKIDQRALDRLEQVEKLVIAQNSQMMRDKAAKTQDYSNFRAQVEFLVNDFPEMEPDDLAVRINSLPFNSFEAFIGENENDKLHKAFIIEEWITRDYPWFRDRLQELKENEPFERYEEYMTKFYDLLLSLGIENPDIEIDELMGEISSSMGVEGADSLEGVLRSVRSLFRDESGQSLVEYGIIFPVITAVITVVVIVAVNLLNPTGTSIPISNIETLSHAMAAMSNIDILSHTFAPTLAQTGTTIITPNIITANMFGNMFMNFGMLKQIMGYLSLVGLVSFIGQMVSRKIGRAQLADGARVQSGISIWKIVVSTIIISIIFVVWFMYQQAIGQLLEQTLLPINHILQANIADPLTAVISIGIGLYYRFVELPQQALRAVPVFRPAPPVQPKVIPQGKLAVRIKILGELLLGGPAKPISVEQFEISLEGLRNRAVQLQDREKSRDIQRSLQEFFRSSVVKSAKNEQEKRVAELETKLSNKLMTGQREVFKEQNTVNELFRMLAEYHASHIPKDQWGDRSLVSQMKIQTQLGLNETADISQLQLADIELAISIIFSGYYLEDMERKAEVEELLRNAFESYNQRMGELSRLEFANKPLDLEWGKANILEVSANMVTGEKFNGQENSSFDKLRAIAEQIKSDPEKFGKDRPIVITGLGLDIQPSEIEAALEKLGNIAGLAAEAIEALKNALKTGKLIFKSATEGNGLVNKAGKMKGRINAFALKNSLPKTVQKMDIFALNKDHWDLNGLKEVVKLLVFLAGGLVQKVETGVVEDIKRINLIKFQA